MTDEAEWVRETFDLVANGGIWMVPRSGLTFRKNLHSQESLTLVSRDPQPMGREPDGTRYDPAAWAAYQEDDYQTIAKHTRDAGIDVFDLTDGVIGTGGP